MDNTARIRARGRRSSSILKTDFNKEDDTKARRVSRRVSFSRTCEVKEFTKDSPQIWKGNQSDEEDEKPPIIRDDRIAASKNSHMIMGLDKLLTGALQTKSREEEDITVPMGFAAAFSHSAVSMGNQRKSSENFDGPEKTHITGLDNLLTGEIQTSVNERSTTGPAMSLQFDLGLPQKENIYQDNTDSPDRKFEFSDFLQKLGKTPTNSLQTLQFSPESVGNSMQFVPMEKAEATVTERQGKGREPFKCLPIPVAANAVSNLHQPLAVVDSETVGRLESRSPDRLHDSASLFKSLQRGQTSAFSSVKKDDIFNLTPVLENSETSNTSLAAAYSPAREVVNFEANVYVDEEISFRGAAKMNDKPESVFLPLQDVEQGHAMFPDEVSMVFDRTMHFKNQGADIDETVCVGGIKSIGELDTSMSPEEVDVNNDVVPSEETVCIGGMIQELDCKNASTHNNTVYFDGMEETRVVGGILRSNMSLLSTRDISSMNTTFGKDRMEETRPIGGILGSNTTTANTSRMDVTLGEVHIDETKCEVGIANEDAEKGYYNHGNMTVFEDGMEETKCMGGITGKDTNVANTILGPSYRADTKLFNTTLGLSVMEETKCVGGVLAMVSTEETDGGNVTLGVDSVKETEYVGGTLKDSTRELTLGNTTLGLSDMEETKCVVGILKKDLTRNVTVANTTLGLGGMEETKCVGGILKHDSAKELNQTNISLGSESMMETRCIDGMKKNYSITEARLANSTLGPSGMEETSCEGGSLKMDLTMERTVANSTLGLGGMEETKCVGGILRRDSTRDINVTNTSLGLVKKEEAKWEGRMISSDMTNEISRANVTMGEGVMEETKCVGRLLDNSMMTDEPLLKSSIESLNSSRQTVPTKTGLDTSSTSSGNRISSLRKRLSLLIPLEDQTANRGNTDDGPTRTRTVDRLHTPSPKSPASNNTTTLIGSSSNESSFSSTNIERRKSSQKTPTQTPNNKTQDITSLFTREQLKEKLILSKKKSLSGTENVGGRHSAKRLHLSENFNNSVQENDTRGVRCDTTTMETDNSLITADLMEYTNEQGIEDEQMPDCIATSLILCNTQSSHSSSSSNGGCGGGHTELSMLQNKSFQSFVVGDGPLTVDNFTKMMRIYRGMNQDMRCSKLYCKRLDMEEFSEVLQAECCLAAEVKAMQEAYAELRQENTKNQETIDWLKQTLEDTQPQIFQDCLNSTPTQLNELQRQVNNLWSKCRDVALQKWKGRTGQAVRQATADMQTAGQQTANRVLSETRADNQHLQQLLEKLDQDMLNLDKKDKKEDQRLQEFEMKEKDLMKVSQRLSVELREKAELIENLKLEMNKDQVKQEDESIKDKLIDQITLHQHLNEWTLDSLSESKAVFKFLNDEIDLDVTFSQRENQVLAVRVNTTSPDCARLPWLHMTHQLAVSAVNTLTTRYKFNSLADLAKLLDKVSLTVNEICQLRSEIHFMSLSKMLHMTDTSLSWQALNIYSLNRVSVCLTFNPSHPMSRPANIVVTVTSGEIRKEDVKCTLEKVEPGIRYLSRLSATLKKVLQ